MCLILVAIDCVPGHRVVLLANRDEFHDRASRAAMPWDEDARVVGGRDRVAGGSWLAARSDGRFAAVTNLRTGIPASAPRSRGRLVRDFVIGDADPASFLAPLATEAGEYGPFNLVVGNGADIHAFDGSSRCQRGLGAGMHTISNGSLTARWPKTERLRHLFVAALDDAPGSRDALLACLLDDAQPTDGQLPDTGVGLALERMLAPIFIRGERYGTRASSLLTIGDAGLICLDEIRHGAGGTDGGGDRWRCDGNGGRWNPDSPSPNGRHRHEV